MNKLSISPDIGWEVKYFVGNDKNISSTSSEIQPEY